MSDVNVLAVGVAAVAVFMLSAVWYIAFGKQLAQLHPAYAEAASEARPPAWEVAVELVRSLVVASVVAGLADLIEITDWTGGCSSEPRCGSDSPSCFGPAPSCMRRSRRSLPPSMPATGS
jgi:hypothetical protein